MVQKFEGEILTSLPVLENGERFYSGAITALLVPSENKNKKKVCFHLIIDESDKTKNLNKKFPGGRVEAVDYDEEMWYANLHAQLRRSGYNSIETSIIEEFFKKKDLSIFEKTFIRELVSETGYIPLSWKFLTGERQKENQVAGKEERDFFQIFFLVKELVQPLRDDHEKMHLVNNAGLCLVDKISPDPSFVPLDHAVKNARLSMDAEKLFSNRNLVRSHHMAAHKAIETLLLDKEFCFALY